MFELNLLHRDYEKGHLFKSFPWGKTKDSHKVSTVQNVKSTDTMCC